MSRWRAYAELVRLPNVFTAVADIAVGGMAAWAVVLPLPWVSFLLLAGASASLYMAGMIWNDYFDLEQDRRERPKRPIPSGRITRSTAARLGSIALIMGLLLAAMAALRPGGVGVEALVLSVGLVAAILLYDGWLKRTWAGPLGMGTCRFLNVLLGLTLLPAEMWGWPMRLHLALVVGLYIVGVTWFARTEAATSDPRTLTSAAIVMASALLLALAVPAWFPPGQSSPLFPYLLVGLALLVGVPALRAIQRPTPSLVQTAVKRSIIALVVLDAVLATAFAGAAGLVILVLLLPVLYLGRWIYST